MSFKAILNEDKLWNWNRSVANSGINPGIMPLGQLLRLVSPQKAVMGFK